MLKILNKNCDKVLGYGSLIDGNIIRESLPFIIADNENGVPVPTHKQEVFILRYYKVIFKSLTPLGETLYKKGLEYTIPFRELYSIGPTMSFTSRPNTKNVENNYLLDSFIKINGIEIY